MSTDQFLILTVIGDDKPGLVGKLAATISAHHGNWLESSMSHLAGKFAGIVKVAVPADHAEALQAALSGLSGLRITGQTAKGEKSALAGRRLAGKIAPASHDAHRLRSIATAPSATANHSVARRQISVADTATGCGNPFMIRSATMVASLPPRPPGRKATLPTSMAKA